MKRGAFLLLPLIALLGNFFVPKILYAHPGNTAADGCHYCRTNCAKWGEVEGARHCHGGYTAPAEIQNIKPLVITTPKPTSTPTFAPVVTPEATTLPQVQAATSEQPSISPPPTTTTELTAGDTAMGLGFLLAFLGLPLWFARKLIMRHNRKVIS